MKTPVVERVGDQAFVFGISGPVCPGVGHFEFGADASAFVPVACSVGRWKIEPGERIKTVLAWPEGCRFVRFVVDRAGWSGE